VQWNGMQRSVLHFLAAGAMECSAACYTSWPRVQCNAVCYTCWPCVHLCYTCSWPLLVLYFCNVDLSGPRCLFACLFHSFSCSSSNVLSCSFISVWLVPPELTIMITGHILAVANGINGRRHPPSRTTKVDPRLDPNVVPLLPRYMVYEENNENHHFVECFVGREGDTQVTILGDPIKVTVATSC
jgi:hypothetical protein